MENKVGSHSKESDWNKVGTFHGTGWFASSLSAALLQLQLFLWTQFIMDPLFPGSREEQKSKIYHLAVVHRTQQAACWAHPGWQLEIQRSGTNIHSTEPNCPLRWDDAICNGKERRLLAFWGTYSQLANRGRATPGEREGNARDGGPWAGVELPLCAGAVLDISHVWRAPVKPCLTEDNPGGRVFRTLSVTKPSCDQLKQKREDID